MSNQVENLFGVAGKYSRVRQFMAAARDGEEALSFRKLAPESTAEEIVGDARLELRDKVNNPIEGEPQADQEVVVVYQFFTAWVPPVEALDEVSKNYPDLGFRLTCVTEVVWVKGQYEWAGGRRVRREESDWETLDAVNWPSSWRWSRPSPDGFVRPSPSTTKTTGVETIHPLKD
jgi:hypothetical protein